jgi:AcrR family transcriptional regulator
MTRCTLTNEAIIATGLLLWHNGTEENVTVSAVARALGVWPRAVRYHCGTTAQLRQAVATEAVRLCDARILAQMIVSGHTLAAGLSSGQRQNALLAAL